MDVFPLPTTENTVLNHCFLLRRFGTPVVEKRREVRKDENRKHSRCEGWRFHFSGGEKCSDSCTVEGKWVIEAKVSLMVGNFAEDYIFISFP